MAEPLLQIEGLSKRFGGVIAADAITLDIPPGEFHAVIGPNGAGKTTLIGLIAGEVAPQQGRVRFDGTDITRLAAYRRSRLGLARSFQITSLFSEFTALDNVALAAQAHRGHSFRFWRDARREEELRNRRRRRLPVSAWRNGPACVSPGSVTASTASLRLRWRWWRSRGSSSSTSRWPAWGRRNRRGWWRCSASSRAA